MNDNDNTIRTCANCGNVMDGKRSDARTCSERCRKASSRNRKRDAERVTHPGPVTHPPGSVTPDVTHPLGSVTPERKRDANRDKKCDGGIRSDVVRDDVERHDFEALVLRTLMFMTQYVTTLESPSEKEDVLASIEAWRSYVVTLDDIKASQDRSNWDRYVIDGREYYDPAGVVPVDDDGTPTFAERALIRGHGDL
jgi:hypothetical protein